MLYKFKSRATADMIMLEASGRQLLTIIGKGDEPHGIITTEQIPAAIEALQAAVAADETADGGERQAQASADPGEAGAQDEEGQPRESVRLRQRAAPFIDMLRRSAAEGHDVIW